MMDFNNKDLAMVNLRKVSRGLKANKVIIMAESYLSHDLSGIRPSMAPDREESIVVQGEDFNGNSCAIIQPFHRIKKGKIKLKKKVIQLKVSPSSRWSGILK